MVLLTGYNKVRTAVFISGTGSNFKSLFKFSKSKIDINLVSEGEKTKVQISDDGPGFPADVAKIVGEPYISSKSKKVRSKSGLGLGTFIGKTLLERKKAEIEFSKSKLGGALVEITWKNSDLVSRS